MQQHDVIIRPFAPADQAVVRRLVLTGLGEHFGFIDETRNPDMDDIWSAYIARGHVFLVALLGETIVGSGALVYEDAQTGRLVRMSVSRDHRRCGIGRMLVQYLVDLARKQGLTRLLIETNNNWHDAIGLYRSCGFELYARDDESVYLQLALEH